MGSFEKFLRLHDPQTPFYQENITILYLPKGPDRMGNIWIKMIMAAHWEGIFGITVKT